MALNILDGILISPFSNVTEFRSGIPWGVRIELDTVGIVEFNADFPGQVITFRVTSDLPTPGTFLYGITFIDGVPLAELRNFAPFTEFDSTKFKMNGSYDVATRTFAFQEPGGTVKEEGAEFWLNVRIPGSFFPTTSNLAVEEVQHPFQFTVAGATNGVEKTVHLFEKPEKGLTLKMPYFEETGPLIQENFFSVDLVWSTDEFRVGQRIIGRRISDTLRASQTFEMFSTWRQSGSPFGGTVTTQSSVPSSDMQWLIDLDIFLAENPQCIGVQGPFVNPGAQSGSITYISGPPTDSGDGARGTFVATPASQTLHRITQMLTSAITGSGTAACTAFTTPPLGDILATSAYIAASQRLFPPDDVSTVEPAWGFDRWKEQ